ncbi:hypothetical protein [Duganella dendranthematis]|uniref:hypothetical protein n=1 Tax=Duganella dendranthematis TaxID=2728021 RepID=UPI001E3F6A99|nr:hypothetical protein [Duganella dendranthematis]
MAIEKLTLLALADTMLAAEASLASQLAACTRVFDAPQPWAPQVCAALLERTGDNFHYFSRQEIADILLQLLVPARAQSDADANDAEDDADADFDSAPLVTDLPPVRRYCIDPPIRPPQADWLAALGLPPLHSVGALAAWLDEPVGALAWLADQWRVPRDEQTRLQHYHYRWVPKRSGGLRLIEIPKARLRRIQQTILRQILDLAPPHAAAHGFRRGRSSVTHAALHAGRQTVVRMDLKGFFPVSNMRASSRCLKNWATRIKWPACWRGCA